VKVHEAEAILKYYADIPQRIEIIRRQCTALSDEVDPMRGMGTDGNAPWWNAWGQHGGDGLPDG